MFVRGLLFAAWALVGAVASYGWLYLLTPYGLVVMGIALCLALAMPLMYAGGSAAVGGSAIVGAVVAGDALAGRALCARA